MVAALGGQSWLTLTSARFQGRTSGFYQGKPTGAIADFSEYFQFPDRTRIEIGKKRNVVEMFTGSQGWEITYRGKRELPSDQVEDFDRRRDHSLQTAMRVWLKDPKTILFSDGQNIVERHLTDQVTLLNADNDSITIQTDAESHLPMRVSWQWRDPVYKDLDKDAEEYDDYHFVEGIATPFTITRFHNGDMTNQRFLYREDYDVPLSPELFDPDLTASRISK